MAISSKIEEIVYEVTKVAGNIYDTIKSSIGDNDTPSSASFEINNLLSMAETGAPYFAILETDPAGFQISYSSSNPYNVSVSSGQIVYNGNTISILEQDISIRRSFSQLYTPNYVYGMVLGLPVVEAQKATQVWNTETSATASIGATQIFIADYTVPETLGFPLEAHVGRYFIKFIGLNADKTALLIDPGQNLGTVDIPKYGKLQSSIQSGTPVRFTYQPRLQSIAGFPILTADGSAMPEDFQYYPPLPSTWLPVGKFLVKNPADQRIVTNASIPAIISTAIPLPLNNDSNPIFGNSDDNQRVIDACQTALSELQSYKSAYYVSETIQGVRTLSSRLVTSSQTSLRKIWAEQPFRVQSHFSKGLSFTGLERFEFPYNFCQAYHELNREDLQHTFAIFRGDLISSNSRLVGSIGITTPYTATMLTAPGSLSSLEKGTHIYGSSVVKSIATDVSGETVPKYVEVVTNSVSNNNYMIELNWTNVADGLFYHVYKRGNLASDLMEYRITSADEIKKQPYFTNTPVADDTNIVLTDTYTAIKVEPNNDGFCGGVSLKLFYQSENYSVKNTSEYISVRLYDSYADTVTALDTEATLDATDTLYVPDVDQPLTDEVKLYYGDLTDQSDEYTFKFKKGVNLTSGHIYWIVIYKSSDIQVINPDTLEVGAGSILTRGLAKSTSVSYGEITLWSSDTFTTSFENWTPFSQQSNYDYAVSVSDPYAYRYLNMYTPYIKLRGFLDNGLSVKYPVRRGLKFTNRIALNPRRITVYVPPVEDITAAVSESYLAAYDGIYTESTVTKNEMIVTVTARLGENGTPKSFTQIIPQGTSRGTRFTLGNSTDLFDRVDDVTVTPGTNLQRSNNGPIQWSLYDLFTVETLP